MPFGRGFGFRGWSPPWPYIGLGRGGLPRCWGYAPFWGAPYSYPYGWGMDCPSYNPLYAYGYPGGYPFTPGSFGSPYGSPMTPEGEKEWLKGQAESINQQIEQINSRIKELEEE